MKMAQVGVVTETTLFSVRDDSGKPVIEEDMWTLKNCWKKPFERLI